MPWKAGDAFKPKSPLTHALIKAGITERATGYVCFVDATKISFYLQRGGPGQGYIEAQCPLPFFGANFVPDNGRIDNPTYAQSKHFPKVFP